MHSIILLAIFAFLCTAYAQRKTITYCLAKHLFIDDASSRKPQRVHKKPTPRAGGIGIFIGSMFCLSNPVGWILVVAGMPAFMCGLADDFFGLSARIRLLFQTISALLFIFITGCSITLETDFFSILGTFIAIFFIIGATNAINIIDGYDGLASGVVFCILLSVSAVAWQVADMVVFETAIIIAATTIGFIFFNYPYAKIFLGDGGAFYLGFLASSLSLYLAYTYTTISLLYPLAVLIYPVTEVLYSMYRKAILRKRSVLQPDRLHIHRLIYEVVTRHNSNTSRYLWKRCVPFVVASSYFYANDLALLVLIVSFIGCYVFLYSRLLSSISSLFKGNS